MKANHFFILIFLFLIVGCSPARLVQTPIPTDDNKAELTVVREYSLNAAVAEMVFGANGSDYAKLSNDSSYSAQLPAGTYDFFVRSTHADEAFILKMQLVAGEHLCLKGFANPNNIAKALMPITYHFSNTFLLERTECHH